MLFIILQNVVFVYCDSFVSQLRGAHEALKNYQEKYDKAIEERPKRSLADLIRKKKQRFSVFKRFYFRKRVL